jgi:hypothetical protein
MLFPLIVLVFVIVGRCGLCFPLYFHIFGVLLRLLSCNSPSLNEICVMRVL